LEVAVSAKQNPAATRKPLQAGRSHLIPVTDRLVRLPIWLLAAGLLFLIFFWIIISNKDYRIILDAIRRGLWTTIYVSVVAYLLAVLLGLLLSLMRVYRSRVTQELASFYVEIVRGIPMLVLLYYISFVGAPALVAALNWLATPLISAGLMTEINVRDIDFTARAILALTLGYGAFISEIFRAGIESIGKEQTEAAQTEGATYWQTMRFILLPQAVRNVLPALGNELIAMLKDSALVSALGVQDITQLGKVYSASTFKFFETYSIVALLYLVMTLGLAMLVRVLEWRLELD
jgi:polar amino acid transport system permease protein